MLGKVRPSSIASLQLLEMERPPAKIVKHDSLSIYESTLLKLKQGSRRNQEEEGCGKPINDNLPEDSAMMSINVECYSFSPNNCQSMPMGPSSKEQQSKNMSLIYLFSKYKSSQQQVHISSDEEATMDVEDRDSFSHCSSVSSPASSS